MRAAESPKAQLVGTPRTLAGRRAPTHFAVVPAGALSKNTHKETHKNTPDGPTHTQTRPMVSSNAARMIADVSLESAARGFDGSLLTFPL